jgi:hypothetical protein
MEFRYDEDFPIFTVIVFTYAINNNPVNNLTQPIRAEFQKYRFHPGHPCHNNLAGFSILFTCKTL